jgi:hypothetical protein
MVPVEELIALFAGDEDFPRTSGSPSVYLAARICEAAQPKTELALIEAIFGPRLRRPTYREEASLKLAFREWDRVGRPEAA